MFAKVGTHIKRREKKKYQDKTVATMLAIKYFA